MHSVHSLSRAGAADGFRLASEDYGTSPPERCLYIEMTPKLIGQDKSKMEIILKLEKKEV